MLRQRLRASAAQVGLALKEPEAFALHWHRAGTPYPVAVFAALALTAMIGTTTYGMIMGLLGGPHRMFASGLYCTVAAGVAWGLSLPALYILNSLTGSGCAPVRRFWPPWLPQAGAAWRWLPASRLPGSSPLPCPGGPYLLPPPVARNGSARRASDRLHRVGVSMADVFCRVMRALEPQRGAWPAFWLILVGVIGAELFISLICSAWRSWAGFEAPSFKKGTHDE